MTMPLAETILGTIGDGHSGESGQIGNKCWGLNLTPLCGEVRNFDVSGSRFVRVIDPPFLVKIISIDISISEERGNI